jgi:hypothetical protein
MIPVIFLEIEFLRLRMELEKRGAATTAPKLSKYCLLS